MSPQRKGSKRGAWKAPRDRREIAVAVLASLAVIVVTASLVWFLRPNRDSGSSSTTDTPTTLPTPAAPTSAPAAAPTTAPAAAPTTAPAATSTP
jgi:hypothetical protein